MPSETIIKACLDVLHFSGIAALTRPWLKGRGVILCLHHIKPKNIVPAEFAPNAHLETTPEFLAEIIAHVRSRGYETISLDKAVNRLAANTKSEKPFAVFTLDDGYKDNQIYAQPVFDRLECPFTIFVAPGIVEATTELWWRGLEAVIAKSATVEVNIESQHFSLSTNTTSQKYKAWSLISAALQVAPEYVQRTIIRDLAKKHSVDLAMQCRESAISWSEIRNIAKDPLCTIGAHTINHHLVAKLSHKDATHEMQRSAEIIARELGKPIEHFAYPYGDETAAGPRDFDIAKGIGFLSAVTTRKGVVFADYANHRHALPRIMVSSRYGRLRYIDALISGAPTFLLNKFKKINVN
jgi:peptidoglycan/xylan/chitin deacetylase (PgdA/CDA1 family)